MSILLCSTSPLKLKAIKNNPHFKDTIIDTIDCSSLNLPNQPINSTLRCAKARLEYAKNNTTKNYDYYVSIENGLSIFTNGVYYLKINIGI